MFLQLLPRGLGLTAPSEGAKNTSATLVKICTNSPGKNITKNKWCDHSLFTLFALPYSIRYCLLLRSKLSWVKTGLFLTLLLFVWEIYLLALLSILTGQRLWASRLTLVSFTPPGRKCYLLSCFSHFPEGLLQGGQPLPKRCLDRVLRGHKPGSNALTHLTGSKWGKGTRVPHGWVGTKWHLSKDMHPE